MKTINRRYLVIALGVVLAACGSESAGTTTSAEPVTTTAPTTITTTTVQATSTTRATTTTTAAITTTNSVDTNQLADGSGCTPGSETLTDGEWFGYVEEVSDTTLSFDLACWFSGEAAAIASAEDGEESPPPNDYYIRNENPLIRELEIAADTPVVFYPSGDPNEVVDTTFSEWDEVASDRGGFYLGVWVTIEDGEVGEIAEQWVP